MENTAARFRDTGQALEAITSGMHYLAGSDAAALTPQEKTGCLIGLEHAEAVLVLARSGLVAAFDVADEFELDGQKTTTAWLVNRGRITKAEALAQKAWVRRAAEHPVLAAAMLDGDLSRSWAAKVITLTGKLPQPHRGQADQIIAAAAKAGATLHHLVYLAAEILARVAPADDDQDKPFNDRHVRLETTLDGAGVLTGDLTPECAAAVQAVLGELAKRNGKDDHRTCGERTHDALLEAMRRLLGSHLAPKRAGQPVTALVHIGLADIMAMDDGSVLMTGWAADLAARWAGHRAGTSVQPGDGGAWLAGPAARGTACDAALIPMVTGTVDLAPLEDLVRLCVELNAHWHHPAGPAPDRDAHQQQMRELMEQIVGRCAAVVSGPDGLAGHLRRNLLGHTGLGGPSLTLDLGETGTIPAWLRRAVAARDQHCRWPGGCDQPAATCHPHHLTTRRDHGRTSLTNILSLCAFHHLIVVHKWGWTITVHGDGAAEARSPDGKTVYRDPSRPPPPRPG